MAPDRWREKSESKLSLKRDANRLALKVAKNREGDSGYSIAMRAHKMTLGATADDKPITTLCDQRILGIVEDAGVEEVSLARLMQIATAMTPGQPMQMAELLRLLGWSADGRGGKQREWVRKALDGATTEKPIIVHLGGDEYRRLWIAMANKHETVFCERIDPVEAKEAAELRKAEAEVTAALKRKSGYGGTGYTAGMAHVALVPQYPCTPICPNNGYGGTMGTSHGALVPRSCCVRRRCKRSR